MRCLRAVDASQGALTAVLDGYVASADGAAGSPDSPDAAIFGRCKAALKSLIRNCATTAPLEPLVMDSEWRAAQPFSVDCGGLGHTGVLTWDPGPH